MYGHLDNIKHFIDSSSNSLAIFCEDDVMIHKRFAEFLPSIVEPFREQDLDLCLLGYLLNFRLPTHYTGFKEISSSSSLYNYTDDVWGSQMFAMSRKQAIYIWEKYGGDYARRTLSDATLGCFSADFVLTKDAVHGKRALLYPPIALEDNLNPDMAHYGNHIGQFEYHKTCFSLHYDPDVYV